MLSGVQDGAAAIVTINAGAGGTEIERRPNKNKENARQNGSFAKRLETALRNFLARRFHFCLLKG